MLILLSHWFGHDISFLPLAILLLYNNMKTFVFKEISDILGKIYFARKNFLHPVSSFSYSFVTYFCRELKEHFAEYTEQVVKLMVPMLKFYFHDGVREPDVSIYMRNSFILPMK